MIELRVAELLKERGRSQYWLAKETGLTSVTISKLVKGTTDSIGLRTLDKICMALDCKPGDVFAYSNREKSKKK